MGGFGIGVAVGSGLGVALDSSDGSLFRGVGDAGGVGGVGAGVCVGAGDGVGLGSAAAGLEDGTATGERAGVRMLLEPGRGVAVARWTASVGVGVGAARAASGTAMLKSSQPTAAINDRRMISG